MCLSKHCSDAVVAHSVHLSIVVCLPVMVSVLLARVTCTDDPHRVKRAIKSQVR